MRECCSVRVVVLLCYCSCSEWHLYSDHWWLLAHLLGWTLSAAAALRTSTAVPVLLQPGLIYMFRVVPTLGEPWELISQIETTQPGKVVIGVSCLVFFQGHPSKYYEPFSALLNFKWKPELQPPHHLSSLSISLINLFVAELHFCIRLCEATSLGPRKKHKLNQLQYLCPK